jgi:succinoglycan biosynthesis protein ExoM
LPALLKAIEEQETGGLFDVSVCIADNDGGESARATVQSFARRSRVSIKYVVEPEQNIARARNAAVENATGSYVAFIDDDELPGNDWLLRLYEMIRKYRCSGVLGPVRPLLPKDTPRWVVTSKIMERPEKETGEVLEWKDTRTGNVLLESRLFENARFDVFYGRGGEDKDFFRRMIRQGECFLSCREAAVHEVIPLNRCKRSFQVKRALLRGKVSIPAPFHGFKRLIFSSGVLLLYVPLLIVSAPLSHGLFMKQLIRACDHVGSILSFFGVNLVKESYLS